MIAITIAVMARPDADAEETDNGENILIIPGNGDIFKNKIN